MASASSQPVGYKWQYIEIELGLNSYKEDFYTHVLPRIRPDWNPESLGCHVFESGVTNTLVAFYLEELGLDNSGEDVILLRVNGEGTSKIINRTDEIVTMLSLNQVGLCPPLYAQLANGLCYGYFPGRRLKVYETSENEVIMMMVAEAMAKLHAMEMPSHFRDREAFLWTKMDEFLVHVPTSFSDPALQKSFLTNIGSRDCLHREISELRSILTTSASPIVFCHNDIHSANIIYNEETGQINLVDYEYSAPNYLAYDIANHFCEFCGVENVDYNRYPKEDVQRKWIRMYLNAAQKLKGGSDHTPSVTDEAIHKLYCDVNKMVLGCHLLWTIWAVFQAANSTIDFDYMKYGILRFKEYLKLKRNISKLL